MVWWHGLLTPEAGTKRLPFSEGEMVILLDPEDDKEFCYRLKRGVQVNLHKGRILLDDILGKEDGSVIRTSLGAPFVVFRPTLRQFIMHMRRDTQIIYPKDLSIILFYADIYPGSTVLEAGIGSGALTLALLRAVGERGKVISYEVREEFVKRARRNVELYMGPPPNHVIKLKDVYEGIEEGDLDRIILDVPEPWKVVEHAARSLRQGGLMLSYLPTVLQVNSLVETLRGNPSFYSIEILEVLLRNWNVEGLSVRPYHRMVGHTGFIVLARKGEGDHGTQR
ncbi:MAG: tRNA (adenine-N1)-methyltransferase [Deltaproteobacteria bacterium]|nr:MAG: tRNA (adenine-N1)-methyltransferase [Deltaproteobacteria bacterium]